MTITVSTDGSALGNPNGPMGWGWADHELATGGKPGHHHEGDCDAGGATNGTNQIGELCAVLEALRAHPGSEPLVIETDSQYAINCSTTWVHGWKKNGWKNSQKKPVKNADLIRAIDAEISKRPGSVKFVWVKGHAGNAGNEKVDELARTYAGDCRSKVREGYLPLEGWQSLLASEYSQGIDVPDDAQMLLDGKITSDEYHIGRGQGESAGDSLADDLIGASDPEPRPRSIADMLVEPEGYPTPDEATLPLPPNGMPAESDEMPEPTTVLATAVSDSTPSDTATSDSTQSDTTAPRKSYAEMLIKTDYFPREDAACRRLMLPEGTPYIDAYPDMTTEEAVEQVVIFDEVYPRRTGIMSDVTTIEVTDKVENEDGTTTEEKWNAYRFRDTGVNFSEKYILPGQELRIRFAAVY